MLRVRVANSEECYSFLAHNMEEAMFCIKAFDASGFELVSIRQSVLDPDENEMLAIVLREYSTSTFVYMYFTDIDRALMAAREIESRKGDIRFVRAFRT